ncbi:hypothetical protein KIL84_002642 [Mauremys mutica]|uniref:Uncharacterized protein n=1 Tax=Mauremys mutica TaxID=74926 RepID=A0A9D4AQM5_9SAUR|nr:hypothetical protein KIL84_002642 [Mauremys mutica]
MFAEVAFAIYFTIYSRENGSVTEGKYFLHLLVGIQLQKRLYAIYFALRVQQKGESSLDCVLLLVPKLSWATILTVLCSVNGKSPLSSSRLVSAAHTHCTQQKFQSIRQMGPSRWKGRKETYEQ